MAHSTTNRNLDKVRVCVRKGDTPYSDLNSDSDANSDDDSSASARGGWLVTLMDRASCVSARGAATVGYE